MFAKGKPVSDSSAANKEAREREARKACLEGDYAKGVSTLSELFLDSKSATYIFNQGRCYEQSEKYLEAIKRFREYLRTPGSDEPALAQKHIAECEELEAKKNLAFVAPATQPVAPNPTPAAAPVTQSQPERIVVTQQSQSTASSGSGLRVAGVAIASVGLVGVVAGVVLNLKANSLGKSISPPNVYDRNKESTRQSYETFSWVGYGVGAVAVATGAILYGVGWGKAGGDSVAIVPVLGPELGGASLRGTF